MLQKLKGKIWTGMLCMRDGACTYFVRPIDCGLCAPGFASVNIVLQRACPHLEGPTVLPQPKFDFLLQFPADRHELQITSIVCPRLLFEPDKDRYHLVVAQQCPFAHRTLMMRH